MLTLGSSTKMKKSVQQSLTNKNIYIDTCIINSLCYKDDQNLCQLCKSFCTSVMEIQKLCISGFLRK